MTSFGFSEEDTELIGVVDVALQSVDAMVPESNAVVVVVTAVATVTADCSCGCGLGRFRLVNFSPRPSSFSPATVCWWW